MDNCWVKSYSHIEQIEHLPPLSLSLFFPSCWPTFMMLLLQPFHIPRPHFSTSDAARWSFFLVSERGLNEEIMAAAPFVAQVLERCTVGWELAGVTRLIWRCCRLWRTLTDRRTDKETYYMATLSCTAANLHHRVHCHTYSKDLGFIVCYYEITIYLCSHSCDCK